MSSLEDLPEDKKNQLLGFAQKILGDKDLSRQVRRIVRDKDPTFAAPDLDLEDQIKAERENSQKEIQALKDELAKKDRNDAWRRDVDRIKESGFDEKYIVELMTKEGIANVETAINHARMQAQLTAPTPASMSSNVLPTAADEMKKLWENPKKWQTEQLTNSVRELRGQGTSRR